MSTLPNTNRLVFSYAVLHARFEIREYFLKTIVKDIYEHIGQVLSLVQIQLFLLSSHGNNVAADTSMPQNLIAQSIVDLRFLCAKVYSDVGIIEHSNWIEGLEYTIKTLNLNNNLPIKIKGLLQEHVGPELRVLLFRTIQEILFTIKDNEYKYYTMRIDSNNDRIIIEVIYLGELIDWHAIHYVNEAQADHNCIRFVERLHLMGADLQILKLRSGKSLIKLDVPINLPLYG